MDEGNDDEPEQGCDEESDPEIHDRFDHKRRLQLTVAREYNDTRAQSPPVQPKISPNPGSALYILYEVSVAAPQNGFQLAFGVNLRYPILAPSRSPTPERIGTTTMLPEARAVMPKPPMK